MWSRRSAIERCRSSATAQLCFVHNLSIIYTQTCGVVDLRSSDVVPPLLLNFTQDQSGNVRFCCIDDRSMIYYVSKVEQ